MAKGIKIKDVQPVSQLQGPELIPISNGSDQPVTVTMETVKDYATQDIESDMEEIRQAIDVIGIETEEIEGSGEYEDFSGDIISL